jgi:hypothetical protein
VFPVVERVMRAWPDASIIHQNVEQ